MKYLVMSIRNGNVVIESEGITNIASAKVTYHNTCKILWNAPDVITGSVAILDEQMDIVEGYKELITHEPTVQPEQVEE